MGQSHGHFELRVWKDSLMSVSYQSARQVAARFRDHRSLLAHGPDMISAQSLSNSCLVVHLRPPNSVSSSDSNLQIPGPWRHGAAKVQVLREIFSICLGSWFRYQVSYLTTAVHIRHNVIQFEVMAAMFSCPLCCPLAGKIKKGVGL